MVCAHLLHGLPDMGDAQLMLLSSRSTWQTSCNCVTAMKPIVFLSVGAGMRVATSLCAGDDAAGGRDAGAADERAEDGAA